MNRQTIVLIVSFFIATITFAQEKKYTTYRVTDKETITSISKKLGITPYDLLKLNPDAKDGINIDEILIVPNRNYKIAVGVTTTKPVKDSIKNGILYHKIQAYETLYSLSKKYKVSKKKIRKLNKLKKKSKIKIGQILKFPTKLVDTESKPSINEDAIVEINGIEYEGYAVKAKETKYAIAKNNGITIEELEKINPSIKNGLKIGEVILIPLKTDANTVVESFEIATYKIHIVQPKETIYKLTNQYNISEEELIALNPSLKEGLKTGMEIKVPSANGKEDITSQLEKNLAGKQLNVVMMLPFKGKNTLGSFANDTKESRSLSRISDFYLGSMIALDSLKSKGLSVNMKVFDTNTKKDNIAISRILNSNNFSNVDLIIGPLYYSNLRQVVLNLQNSNAVIVSPIAKKDHAKIGTSNIIQNAPSDKQLQLNILNHIKENYTDQNLIIIADEDEKIMKKINEVTTHLKKDSKINKITVLRLKDGYIKKENFEKNIKKDKENWVILVTNSKRSTTSVAVDNFGFLNKEFKVTLFALKKGDNFKDVKNSFLNRLQLHYPSANFVDEKRANVAAFIKEFKNKYTVEPSSFIYRGFDTTYDALIRVATNNDAFQGRTKRLNSIFNYDKKASCYSNNGIYIIKYNDYQLEEVK
jgi:LysM repeat protein